MHAVMAFALHVHFIQWWEGTHKTVKLYVKKLMYQESNSSFPKC